ncbi:hypothetical protein KDH_17090 [Dictyobacter sp. S3.2.2.5]|uniref:DoxX family protein n=1 Tax=Dictyobacter halimunensis TaxID=3026934 RepID=A0ABQ6FPT0_9CHLR|nr:hypothetical protein KDH_16600 [Dictyobacter sp. S3.2.2.5]GLV54862.1 hypothetical protein KDH_17090 [Dictyobacter sp. S3.2.2.5]
MSLSIGLLILRLVVGLLLMGHGAQKLFGWFGGHGFAGTTGWLKSQGFVPAAFWTVLGAGGEFVGGLLFVLGLLTPLAAIAIIASMLMAVVRFHWSSGLWSTQGGYEYPLVLMFVGLAVALTGPGAYALDALIGFALPAVLFWILLLVAIVVVVVGTISSNRQAAQQVSRQKVA